MIPKISIANAALHINLIFTSFVISIVPFILSIIFMGLIFKLDVLPTKYFIAASAVLIVLAVICFVLQFRKHAHWAGKIISVIVILIMIFGSVYVGKTMYTLGSVTKVKTYQTDKIVIAVLADDPAQSLADAKDYKFGILEGKDRTKVDLAIDQINSNLDSEINTTEYSTYSEQVQALYSLSLIHI